MGTRTETLSVKITSDGAGNIRAELSGVGDSIKRIGDTSASANNGMATLGTTLRNLAVGGGALLGLREIANTVGAVGAAAIESEQSEARLNGMLRATGANARTSAAEINELVLALSKRTGLGDDEIRNAAAHLLTFKNVQGEVFRDALGLGADWAALFGGDVVSGIEKVGRALQEPFNGVRLLARELGGLDAVQEATIKRFEKFNDVAGATQFNLTLIRGAVSGLATEMHTGLRGEIDETKNAWDRFLEGIGQSELFQRTAQRLLATARRDLAYLTPDEPGVSNKGRIRREANGGPNDPPDAAMLAQQQAEKSKLAADAAKFLAEVEKDNLDLLVKSAVETQRIIDGLNLKANAYRNTNVEAINYRITLGDLAHKTDVEKTALLQAAQAADDKLQTDKELAQSDFQATLRAVARADAEERTADALKNSADAARDRARGLADRGDPIGAAGRKLEGDTDAINATFADDPASRFAALQQAQQDYVDATKDQSVEWGDAWTSAGNRFAAGIGDAVADAFTQQQSFADAMGRLLVSVGHQVISMLVEIGVKKLALNAIEEAMRAQRTIASVTEAAITAIAWKPAAAAVSLGTAGVNAVPAAAGASAVFALLDSLVGQAHDGLDYVPRTGTYILEEGEAVIQKDQNKALRDSLKGGGGSRGGNVTFNIRTNDARGFDQLLRSRRGMITRMIQQAYNTKGRGSLGPGG